MKGWKGSRVAAGRDPSNAATLRSLRPCKRVYPVPMTDARWTRGFWAARFELCLKSVVPLMREALLDPRNSASLANFLVAAGRRKGKRRGTDWSDGDCYKWIEAMAHLYAVTGEPGLDREMDRWIGLIAAVQEPDGYVGTQVQLVPGRKRWSARRHHELYCMGHLLTAACVHHRATGKKEFLRIARKLADYLVRVFGPRPARLAHYGWNPSNIMGLVDIYRATGERRYLDLAGTFVDMRGSRPWPAPAARMNDPDPGDQNQDRVALRAETEAVGHAVTAMYLWCGAADVCAETGERRLLRALERIWRNVTERKMYVTGAVGAYHAGVSPRGDRVHEAFGRDYELPNETAYNETCANIGNAMWNWRMLNLTGNARHADVLEQVLYNSALSGMSIDGTRFMYTNPLARDSDGKMLSNDSRERWSVWSCYCCPPQVARTLASVHEWAYGVSGDAVWVHLYGGSAFSAALPGRGRVRLRQETDYPWDGRVRITIEEAVASPFALVLRIPGWARRALLRVNGRKRARRPGTYARTLRRWREGDTVTLELPMAARLVESQPKVRETRDHVAIQRGPVVYCLESADLPRGVAVSEIHVPVLARFTAKWMPRLLGGVTVLEGAAIRKSRPDSAGERVAIRMIPYYAWLNRRPGGMRVWLPLA